MSSLSEMEVSLNDVPSKTLNFILSEYKFKTIEELYVEIGLGNVIPKLIALRWPHHSSKILVRLYTT